jgi:hypothetical protein
LPVGQLLTGQLLEQVGEFPDTGVHSRARAEDDRRGYEVDDLAN